VNFKIILNEKKPCKNVNSFLNVNILDILNEEWDEGDPIQSGE